MVIIKEENKFKKDKIGKDSTGRILFNFFDGKFWTPTKTEECCESLFNTNDPASLLINSWAVLLYLYLHLLSILFPVRSYTFISISVYTSLMILTKNTPNIKHIIPKTSNNVLTSWKIQC